jgi:hypothetical protein
MRKRRELDSYYTPTSAVQELRKRVRISGQMYEPCVGKGAIAEQFADCRPITNDIDPNVKANTYIDARNYRVTANKDALGPWVVTNPPFNQAFEILQNFVNQDCRIALLLRLSFLEPTFDRGDWLEAHPPSGIIVLPRISFTGDGKTDQVTVAWILWNSDLEPAIQVVSKGTKSK